MPIAQKKRISSDKILYRPASKQKSHLKLIAQMAFLSFTGRPNLIQSRINVSSQPEYNYGFLISPVGTHPDMALLHTQQRRSDF